MSLRTKLLGLAAGLSLTVGGAAGTLADDVQLFHDKGFWSEAFQNMGDAAARDTGNRIVEVAYANPEQYKAFIQSAIASGEPPDMFTWWTGGVYKDLVESGQGGFVLRPFASPARELPEIVDFFPVS